jgi:hypothetical protein
MAPVIPISSTTTPRLCSAKPSALVTITFWDSAIFDTFCAGVQGAPFKTEALTSNVCTTSSGDLSYHYRSIWAIQRRHVSLTNLHVHFFLFGGARWTLAAPLYHFAFLGSRSRELFSFVLFRLSRAFLIAFTYDVNGHHAYRVVLAFVFWWSARDRCCTWCGGDPWIKDCGLRGRRASWTEILTLPIP